MSEIESPIVTSHLVPPHLTSASVVVRAVLAIASASLCFLPWHLAPGADVPCTGYRHFGAGLLVLTGLQLLAAWFPRASPRPQVGFASGLATLVAAAAALARVKGPVHGGDALVVGRGLELFRALQWLTLALGAWQAYLHGVALTRARALTRAP